MRQTTSLQPVLTQVKLYLKYRVIEMLLIKLTLLSSATCAFWAEMDYCFCSTAWDMDKWPLVSVTIWT